MLSFPGWFSLLPLCGLFRLFFRRFGWIFRTPCPVLRDFLLPLND